MKGQNLIRPTFQLGFPSMFLLLSVPFCSNLYRHGVQTLVSGLLLLAAGLGDRFVILIFILGFLNLDNFGWWLFCICCRRLG